MNELMNTPDVDDAEMRMMETTGKRLILSSQFAQTMSRASLLPEHLRTRRKDGIVTNLEPEEIQANCVLIVNQALRWGVDPFAILPSTFVIAGRLGFDGKLIAAIVNKLGNLAEKLNYEFYGEGDDRTVIVSGRIEGEHEPRTVEVSVGQAKTDNEIWKKDPDQKLCYTGATRWARRHCPQVILGILSDDEPAYETVNGRTVPRDEREKIVDRLQVNGDCANEYVKRLNAATSTDEVSQIIEEAQREPIERINDAIVTHLKTVGRAIYKRLIKEAAAAKAAAEPAAGPATEPQSAVNFEHILNQYNEDIEAATTRAQIADLLESLNSEEHIPLAARKSMSKWANDLAAKLPA